MKLFTNKILICLLLLSSINLSAETKDTFNPDVELKIIGLVCPSCAIGIKNGFLKTKLIKKLKFDSKKIVQLGLTFKPESDDLRDSQSIELNKSLIKEGYEVKTYDPFLNSDEELSKIMEFSNNILISTHHKIFDSYDFTDKKVVIVGDK